MTWGSLSRVAVVAVTLAGCYTLKPAGGVPPAVGERVAFDVNDAGRVALGGTMGPEIAQVEGTLLDKDSTSYLMAVENVRTIRGGEQPWSREQVRLKTEYLSYAYERRFSIGRSLVMGAIGAGGVGAFFLTRSLFGGGTHEGDQCGLINCDSTPTRLGRP